VTTLILGLCALACPLSMLVMMWMMRRRNAHPPERAEK
jgi:hypothetical protein